MLSSYQTNVMPTLSSQLVHTKEKQFREFVNEATEEDLSHQRDLLQQELDKPAYQNLRTPVLDLARERLGILNQSLGF
jgi:hypothetical protein